MKNLSCYQLLGAPPRRDHLKYITNKGSSKSSSKSKKSYTAANFGKWGLLVVYFKHSKRNHFCRWGQLYATNRN